MLRELAGVPAARRTARYRAVIAITAPDGREVAIEGTVEGLILESPRGDGGFGYDPIFYYPAFGMSFGEVSATAKHAVSHRGRALAQARALLRRWAS
jgi:XTP/dITP diphosphohydrolase